MIIYISFVIIVQNSQYLAVFQIFNIEFCKVYFDAKLLDFMII